VSALGDHSYIICFSAKVILSNDATETNQESKVAFFHMYKVGIVYYSTRYVEDRELKRENTICSFRCRDSSIKYSQISFFVADPRLVALIKMCHIDTVSLMQSARNPSNTKPDQHKDIDFLSTITQPVIFSSTFIAVSINDIIGKPVMIKVDSTTYLIDQPEHH